MSLLRLGALAALVTATGLLACSSAGGDDEAEASASAVTKDRIVTVGTCRMPLPPVDPSAALPPAEQVTGRRLRDVSRDEIMTQADLRVRVRTGPNGKRVIASLDAQLAAGFARGAARVTVASTSGQATKLQTSAGEVEYQTRTLVAPDFGLLGTITFGGEAIPLGVAVLHREPASRRGWISFGTHDDELLAVAPGCTFDERAWALLADTACEGPLYADAGADAGPASCEVALPDAGVDASAGNPTAVDAGARGDASADGGAPVDNPDVGTHAPGTDTSAPGADDPPSTDDGAEGSYETEPEDDEAGPAKKTASAANGGCSAAPGSASTGTALGLGLGLALALAAGRRRRVR